VLSATPNAIALLKALRRRWLLASVLGILAAAATAVGVWFFLPAGKYTAYAKLYMPMREEKPVVWGPEREAAADFLNFQRTQVAILRGRPVLYDALRKPKVKPLNLEAVAKNVLPVEWLEKELRVEFPDGPELPRVTMTGDDDVLPKVLVSAVVEAYLEAQDNRQKERRQDRLDKLKDIKRKYSEQVTLLRDKRKKLVKAIGANEGKIVALRQELGVKQLAAAQSELLKVEADLRRMELEAKFYEGREGTTREVPDKLIEGYIDKDLEKEFAAQRELELRLDKALKTVDDESNPKIRQLRGEIEAKKKVIAEEREKLRPQYRARLLEKGQNDAKAQLIQVNEQIKFNKAFKELLLAEVERLEKEGKDLTDQGIGLEDDRIELAQAESGLGLVTAELDRATVEPPPLSRVRLQEETVVVAPDETTRRLRAAGLGAGGALAVVLLLVSFLEFRSRRLDSTDELVRGLGLELMGTLPAAPRRFGGSLIRSTAADTASWQSLLAESVDSARTLLLRSAGPGKIRVVMITSAASGEGKTSLATHLAASLARAGRKTLLLDGDLRKPAAHRIFDLPAAPGLSELLRGEVDLSAVVRPTQAPGLAVLPAGECDGEAIRRLARDGIQQLVEALKQEYEFIVIDSSPVLPVADALLLAQHVDGVLLSLFHEVSRLPKVYAACQRLSLMGVPILGVVVNGTHEDAHGYGQTYAKAQSA
jgi:capsular exopolysaccharide synthesis family protein